LQQPRISKIGTADITPKKRPGGNRKYGKKSIDSPSRIERQDWKNDKKSFNSSRIARKSIVVFNNSQKKRGNNSAKERMYHISFDDSNGTG
jgi:hypothetical protein